MDIALAPQPVIIRKTAFVTTLRTATIAMAHTSLVVVLAIPIPLRVARSEKEDHQVVSPNYLNAEK